MRIALFVILVVLAGCQSDSRLTGPSGQRPAGQAADPLPVAHRLADAGEHELALRAYLRAAAEQGLTSEILSGLGRSNLVLGRLGQAEDNLRLALERNPENIAALNNLGVLEMERGRPGAARGLFQQAFALDSGRSEEIRANLQLAIARSQDSAYSGDEAGAFALIREGSGLYMLAPSSQNATD